MAKKSETYLLPIWIDIMCHGEPRDVLIDLNDRLTEFFESYGQAVQENGQTDSSRQNFCREQIDGYEYANGM